MNEKDEERLTAPKLKIILRAIVNYPHSFLEKFKSEETISRYPLLKSSFQQKEVY